MAKQSFMLQMCSYVIISLFLGMFITGLMTSCSSPESPQPIDFETPSEEPVSTDNKPPQIEEIFPDNDATGIPVDAVIQFRLKDDLSGVDTSSIIMKINDKPIAPLISGDTYDILIEYQAEQPLSYGETVVVYVRVQDLAPVPNHIEYTFEFIVEQDKNKPYTTGLSPMAGSINVPVNTKISFHLMDDEEGVDRSSIVVKINDTPIIPLISGNAQDYLVEYEPSNAFVYGEIVSVSVAALDLGAKPNRMEYTFAFTIEEDSGDSTETYSGNIRLDIIYYGKHSPEIDSLIVSVAPRYLIGNPAHGLWGEAYGYDTWWLLQDVARFQEAGIKVIGYLTSGYEGVGSGSGIETKWYTLEMNKKLIANMAEKDGVDGIFIDECSNYPNAESKRYLKELADVAHSYGLIVWGNVGHDSFDEWFFTDGGFDMMNASENWQGQTLTQVQEKWGRFISVSGFYNGHDVEDVYNLVQDAWDKGLAYAYITGDAYARLPSWIEQLAELIRTNHK